MTENELIHVVASETITPPSATWCVESLEFCGGSLTKWLEQHPQNKIGDEGLVVARTEKWLSELEDRSLYKRWNIAIKQNAIVRLRLLQNKALARLEMLADGENVNWLGMAREANAHKMLLGDLLAGQTFAAKQKPVAELEEKDDDDDEIEELMRNA